jgi:hypothetical protein
MSAKKTTSTSEKAAQIERFMETARALGCDEDKERFEGALGKIAAHKPRDAQKKEYVKAKASKAKASKAQDR